MENNYAQDLVNEVESQDEIFSLGTPEMEVLELDLPSFDFTNLETDF